MSLPPKPKSRSGWRNKHSHKPELPAPEGCLWASATTGTAPPGVSGPDGRAGAVDQNLPGGHEGLCDSHEHQAGL